MAAIEPHLPRNQPGARGVDDRRAISGIVHVLKVGCRWYDCPADYGLSTTIYNRFNRWSRRGFWLKLLDALVDAGVVTKSTAIDSTYIKAQRAASRGSHARSSRCRCIPCAGAHRSRCTPTWDTSRYASPRTHWDCARSAGGPRRAGRALGAIAAPDAAQRTFIFSAGIDPTARSRPNSLHSARRNSPGRTNTCEVIRSAIFSRPTP